jgi:uncharacterized membrane protein YuzA (DUF378 family)
MDKILARRPNIKDYVDHVMPERTMGIYDNTWGAGMYGAFYSPRNTRRFNTTDRNGERNAKLHAKKVEDALANSRDYLQDIQKSLSENLKTITRGLLGIKSKEDVHRGKGRIGTEDRDEILKTILGKPTYTTKTQFRRGEAIAARDELLHRFSKRGVSDMLFGAPQEGSARAAGREYDDALKQYQKDRMMLQGKQLIETYGSKRGAEKQIAKDFKVQQDIGRQIAETNKEVERRRKNGWNDADINSPEAGKMLDRLNGLIDQFAKYDPTHTGRYLERDVDPKKKPKDMTLPSERFRANQAVYKGGEREDKIGPAPKALIKSQEEADLESEEQHKKDQEEQVKQTGLLENIKDALTKKDKVEGYSDGKPEGIGWLSDLLKPLSLIGNLAKGLMGVAGTLLTSLGGLGPILATLGAVLVPLAAAAALLGLGKAEKEKIEANPNAPEYKDNAYAMKLRGEATSVGQAAQVNTQKALRNLAPGVAKQLLEEGQQDENGMIDGYTMDQLMDMRDGKKPSNMPDTPLAKKAKLEAAQIKPVPANTGTKLNDASIANADAKRESSKPSVTVVAPSTTNNNSSTAAPPAPMPPVRNTDTTMTDYVRRRYAS